MSLPPPPSRSPPSQLSPTLAPAMADHATDIEKSADDKEASVIERHAPPYRVDVVPRNKGAFGRVRLLHLGTR